MMAPSATHVAGIVRNFLDFAPDEGPLFQTTTKVGDSQWSGRPMTPAILTEKLQKALADNRLGLGWPWETVKEYTAHSLRSSTATAMARGGVAEALVSAVLGHKTQTVTQDHYVQFTKEDMRRALAITGTKIPESDVESEVIDVESSDEEADENSVRL